MGREVMRGRIAVADERLLRTRSGYANTNDPDNGACSRCAHTLQVVQPYTPVNAVVFFGQGLEQFREVQRVVVLDDKRGRVDFNGLVDVRIADAFEHRRTVSEIAASKQ